jgi:hypothetical protein
MLRSDNSLRGTLARIVLKGRPVHTDNGCARPLSAADTTHRGCARARARGRRSRRARGRGLRRSKSHRRCVRGLARDTTKTRARRVSSVEHLCAQYVELQQLASQTKQGLCLTVVAVIVACENEPTGGEKKSAGTAARGGRPTGCCCASPCPPWPWPWPWLPLSWLSAMPTPRQALLKCGVAG